MSQLLIIEDQALLCLRKSLFIEAGFRSIGTTVIRFAAQFRLFLFGNDDAFKRSV